MKKVVHHFIFLALFALALAFAINPPESYNIPRETSRDVIGGSAIVYETTKANAEKVQASAIYFNGSNSKY